MTFKFVHTPPQKIYTPIVFFRSAYRPVPLNSDNETVNPLVREDQEVENLMWQYVKGKVTRLEDDVKLEILWLIGSFL